MKKTVFAMLSCAVLMTAGKAQTIQEGLNHLYADRIQSAIGVFEKLLAQNPNNIEAAYWLGQTYFDDDKNDKAKEVYDKAITSSNNAPLIMVGMGHFLLLDKKTNEARQMFETAITNSKDRKGKDNPDILNAVGRAHTDAKTGDYKYAEQVLQAAIVLNQKNPDYFLNLGNAIRKARPGEAGRDAYKAYTDALNLNPNFAYIYVRIAKLFETQRNWDLVLENLNKAASVDPNFSLAYYELFYYYFPRKDFANAETYFNKYIDTRPNEDKWEHDYLKAQLCWVKKDFDCAIEKAESVRTLHGSKVKPRVLRLLAYAYLDKKDFAKAKAADDEFFSKEKDGFNAADYKRKAEIAAGSGTPCEELFGIYMAGAAVDTVLQDKIDYMTEAAEDFKRRGCKKIEADMRMAIFNTRTKPNIYGLINIGTLYFQAESFVKADSIFTALSAVYPDSLLPYYWRGRTSYRLDTTMMNEPFATNLINSYSKALDIALTDKVRHKNLGIYSALRLGEYYVIVKKDYPTALSFTLKGMEIDSNDVNLRTRRDQLTPKPANPRQGNTQPARTGTGKEPKPVATSPEKSPAAKPRITTTKKPAVKGTTTKTSVVTKINTAQV